MTRHERYALIQAVCSVVVLAVTLTALLLLSLGVIHL